MGEIDSQNGIAIDVGFGNITFCRDETGTYACAAVEITRRDHPADTIEMTLRVPASHHDPLAEIVERSRVQILDLLRGAVDRLERETAEARIDPRLCFRAARKSGSFGGRSGYVRKNITIAIDY